MRPVAPIPVSGIGLLSPAGVGIAPLWSCVLEERSLIRDGIGSIPPAVEEELRGHAPRKLSRGALFAWAAARQAMDQAGWKALSPEDGLIFATTVGQAPSWQQELVDYSLGKLTASGFAPAFRQQPLGALSETLCESLEFSGRALLLSSACSAATQAIALAAAWIRQGRVRRCLVGGVEVLSRLTVEGFRSLQLLSSEPATPFDAGRKGINLSEAAAFLCLEQPSHRNGLALISGHGLSTDAYHMASPHPEGEGSLQAMRTALGRAGIGLADVGFVHAHGTGSRANDQAEAAALSRLFGEQPPWVCSTKWVHGHALGASGALESALCIHALQEGLVLRTPGLVQPDPALAVRHPERSFRAPIRHVLKNTLGFGGNNAALVISASEERHA